MRYDNVFLQMEQWPKYGSTRYIPILKLWFCLADSVNLESDAKKTLVNFKIFLHFISYLLQVCKNRASYNSNGQFHLVPVLFAQTLQYI